MTAEMGCSDDDLGREKAGCLPRWRFGCMTPAEINQDPVQGEFFSREADLPGRLVREAIQNSLDARLGAEPVRVRFVFSGEVSALRATRAARYLNGLEEHVVAVAEAEAAGLERVTAEVPNETTAADDARVCFGRPMTYLVVEDFGTRGLTGDTQANSESEQGNDFWGFFRSVGISPKGENDAGSWGLGKWVFPDASVINAYFGMTQRSGEDDWLLMGMALLKTHHCGEIKYRYYGSFAQPDDADEDSWLPVPLNSSDPKDGDFIVEALADFNLERLDGPGLSDPGLSVVVPFPKPELTPAAIAHAVLTQYFLPIVSNDLVVEITHPEEGSRTIDHASILKEADQVTPTEQNDLSERPDESPDSLRRAIGLARWATEQSEDEHLVLEAPSRGRRVEIGPRLATLRERYEQGERLAIRLTTAVRSKAGTVRRTDFRVYLERAEDLAEGHDYFVRGHLRIPHMDHIRRFKARALVLVDGRSELGHLLRDAEGPAHDRWDRGAARLKQRWRGGQDRVDEVRRTPAHLLQHLVERPDERQMDALADLFPGDPAQIGKGRGGKRGGALPRSDTLPPPPPNLLQVDSPAGAFVVRPTKQGEKSGLANRAWDLRFAYDTVRGNPFVAFEAGFRQGSPDFSLEGGTLAIEADGCEYEPTGPNTLRFTATMDAFRLRLSGFDDRDVKVAVEEVREGGEHEEGVGEVEEGTP